MQACHSRIILEQHAEHGNALGKFCQRDMAQRDWTGWLGI